MKNFVLCVFLNYFLIQIAFSTKSKSDPFSKMSDKELEKMLKDMGMSEKELSGIGGNELLL